MIINTDIIIKKGIFMELSREQINKILELADKTNIDIDQVTSLDISKALIEIERKLNFFDVDISFKSDSKNVLIVDDLELSLYHLNQLMKKVGIRTFVARNKEEAKAEIIRRNFDYLLLDLFLPDCEDGLALIKEAIEIKDSGRQNYKIIVVSGSDDKRLIEECYKLGIDGYVTKTENWHTDILKYINTENEYRENNTFNKKIISSEIVLYKLKKFNDKTIFDDLMADINISMLDGRPNVLLNVEKVMVFDQDNTYFFAEIYKSCQNSGGSLMLLNPSEKIKEALSCAYLEGIIPVFHNTAEAEDYVIKLKNKI